MELRQDVNTQLDSIKKEMNQASSLLDIYIRSTSIEDASELAVLQIIEDKIYGAQAAIKEVQQRKVGTQNGAPIFLLHGKL